MSGIIENSSFINGFSVSESDVEDSDYEDAHDYGTDDDSSFSLSSLQEGELEGMVNDLEESPMDEDVLLGHTSVAENVQEIEYNAKSTDESEDDDSASGDIPIPKGKSIAHHHMHSDIVYCSFDLETGGEFCGIVQMSAQMFRIRVENGKMVGEIEEETFNEYVKPPDGSIWSTHATDVHGLHESHPQIIDADPIQIVWEDFTKYVNRHIGPSQRGVLVAWNGETCDMKWIYKIAQAPNSKLSMPSRIKDFMDPLKVIRSYKSC